MDPFATLGLPRRYEIDLRQLESRYRELQKALHPDRHAGAGASQRRMSALKAALVNDAYRALKDDLRRAEALLALYGAATAAGDQREDPQFLLEMLELREALSEARQSDDAKRVAELSAQVEAMQRSTRDELCAAFEALAEAATSAELQPAQRAVGRLKYFRRFLDEVGAAQEEGAG
jgi:molecular chaperone HscB